MQSASPLLTQRRPTSLRMSIRRGSPGTPASQLMQELDHCGVDLRRSLLLGPMTAVPKNYCATQSRHVVCQIGDNLIRALRR